jgi:hypothetical protein
LKNNYYFWILVSAQHFQYFFSFLAELGVKGFVVAVVAVVAEFAANKDNYLMDYFVLGENFRLKDAEVILDEAAGAQNFASSEVVVSDVEFVYEIVDFAVQAVYVVFYDVVSVVVSVAFGALEVVS